jgi:hypothetical protein
MRALPLPWPETSSYTKGALVDFLATLAIYAITPAPFLFSLDGKERPIGTNTEQSSTF